MSPNRTNLPDSLAVDQRGDIAVLRLNPRTRRNAIDDRTALGIGTFCASLDPTIRAVVLDAAGDHLLGGARPVRARRNRDLIWAPGCSSSH